MVILTNLLLALVHARALQSRQFHQVRVHLMDDDRGRLDERPNADFCLERDVACVAELVAQRLEGLGREARARLEGGGEDLMPDAELGRDVGRRDVVAEEVEGVDEGRGIVMDDAAQKAASGRIVSSQPDKKDTKKESAH